jgi:hypothetical protein
MTLPISDCRFAILSGDEPRSSEDRQVAVLKWPVYDFRTQTGNLSIREESGKGDGESRPIGNRKSKIENVVAR